MSQPANLETQSFDNIDGRAATVIQNQLVNYWIQKEELPEEIDELSKDKLSGFVLPIDPETEENYEYTKLTAFSFELCATFKTESKNNNEQNYGFHKSDLLTPPLRLIPDQFNLWTHGSGRTCFERSIDPELYKKQP